MKRFIFAIDFDGTIVQSDKELNIQNLIPGAKETINWLFE